MCTRLEGTEVYITALYSLLRSMKDAGEHASTVCKIFSVKILCISDVRLTVHRNSIWIRKTN